MKTREDEQQMMNRYSQASGNSTRHKAKEETENRPSTVAGCSVVTEERDRNESKSI